MAPSSLFLCFLSLFFFSTLIHAKIPGVFTSGPWQSGHATFYGGSDASGTMGGACGYGNLDSQGYGVNTAAPSTALFNQPLSYGACFEITCAANDTQWCKPDNPSIFITATGFCHSNISHHFDNGDWCHSPRPHFKLSMPMFLKIADHRAGIVPIDFHRVPCQNKGGMMFNITRFDDMNQVLISNVAGAGNIVNVSVKEGDSGWLHMPRGCRNWGEYWQLDANLTGKALSFRVTGSDGRTSTSYNIAPANWKLGQSFVGKNFRV